MCSSVTYSSAGADCALGLCNIFHPSYIPPLFPYSIVIGGGHNSYFGGGSEALVQLALAFHTLHPTTTYFGGQRRDPHTVFTTEYPNMTAIPWNTLDQLKPGDVYVIPEVLACPKALVARGVRVYVWQLGAITGNARRSAEGCRHLSHNFYLSHSHEVDVPSTHVIRPFITPSIVRHANDSIWTRENLVLVDNDTPPRIINEVKQRISHSEGAEAIVVSGFKRSELPSLYRRAKVVVDWCMRGTERMPIEASVNGALLLTSECQSATDRRDFPLPSFALTSRSSLDTRSLV
jgi:hypothetical protein